jgi:class 3 adenylate cyclase/tetratricopeptide (TPR) repeat protein
MEGVPMTFQEVLAQVIAWLQGEQRVSYRALKRQFDLDDDYIEDLKDELIYAKKLAVDEDGRVLVWTGDTASVLGSASAVESATDQDRAPLSYTPRHLADKILTSRSALEGERKQVTVLFADIKDSTELIRDLDPEAAQQLLDPAIHIMMDAVHRFEGTLNQVLGDGIMALFGAPIAHEDHAARACYTALAMQTAMRDYTKEVRRAHGIPLQIRVGLNAGEVVARAIGNDLHMDYSAFGQTTHLAARMEQLAKAGNIMLTASTLRLVEGLVRVNALGPIPVKGITEPVEVYELVGVSAIKRRLQAAVARGLTTFVGRDTEVAALNQALEQAGAGHGQVVAAVGEAGVGKSRLVYEFTHSHRVQGWLVLESASVSYGKATPYFPVVDLLKRYVRVEESDDARTIRAKVTGQIVTLDASLQETIPALLSLLDALLEDSPFLQLDPPQRRQRTLDGLKRILLRESQVQPLLLVFEDLHWIDSETQALLDRLVESLPTAQLLLLVNYRPEYQYSWGSKTYYTQLRLDPLPSESADAFLEALLGDDPSLEPLKKLLIERTEGNPFFLEENVRTLVETQVLVGESGAYRLAQQLPTIHVPATVQAILAARIDRLPQDEKRLLQTAAVIGTEVPFTLLQGMTEMSEEALSRGLSHLQTTEFLYETSLFPERVYTFKHALTHEVTYGSLLQESRRELHAQIVETLETHVDNQMAEEVERLAHHAVRGEVWNKAVAYARQAANKAMAHSAHSEAVSYFEQALHALQHLPENHERMVQDIDLRLDLRNALLPLGGHERMLDHMQSAETLAETLDDSHRLGRIFGNICNYFMFAGVLDRAVAYAQRTLDLAMAHNILSLQVQAHRALGLVYHEMGEYCQAIASMRQSIALLEGDLVYEHFGRLAAPSVTSRMFSASCLAERGDFDTGRVIGEEGLRIAEDIAQPYTLVLTLTHGVGLLHHRQDDFAIAIPVLQRSLTLCQNESIEVHFPLTASLLVSAYAHVERIADAWDLLGRIEDGIAFESQFNPSATFIELGQGLQLLGSLQKAYTQAERAFTLATARKERGNQAWALHLLGDIAMHRDFPEIEQAETHYNKPSPWQSNSACVHFRPIATVALAPCIVRLDSQSKLVPN